MLRRAAMSDAPKVRCYQYIDRPYAQIGGLLRTRSLPLMEHASRSAAARASSLTTSLRIAVGGIELGIEVRPRIERPREEEGIAGMSPVTRVDLAWEAAHSQGLFPSMQATLSAWPLSSTETQIEIEGEYRPPLGPVGKVLDAALLHRIAEASVHRLLDDLIEQIRIETRPET